MARKLEVNPATGELDLIDEYNDSAVIKQGGNTFATPVIIGSNDNNAVNIETNNVTRVTVNTNGSTLVSYDDTTASVAGLTVNNTQSTNATAILRLTSNALAGTKQHDIQGSDGAVTISNRTDSIPLLVATGSNAIGHRLQYGGSNFPTASLFHLSSSFTTQTGNNASNKYLVTEGGVLRLGVSSANVIYTNTPNYDTLVTANSHIPNKLYVDNNFKNVYNQTVTTSTGNVTTETDIMGTYLLPANTVKVGSTIRIRFTGLYGRGAGNSTFRIYFGAGTLVAFTPSANLPNATADGGYIGEVILTVRSIGGTGTVVCGGGINAGSTTFSIKNAQISGTASSTATTVNTTIANQLRVTHQFSATNADNQFNTLIATIDVINN